MFTKFNVFDQTGNEVYKLLHINLKYYIVYFQINKFNSWEYENKISKTSLEI